MKQKNHWGNIFLISAAVGFVFCMWEPWFALEQIHLFSTLTLRALLVSFFEASLVGAVADWFAVTALFRRPLGLPIPHTDILARKKDALAEAVPKFLSGFLQPEALSPLLQRYDFAAKLHELVHDQRPQFQSMVAGAVQMIATHLKAPALFASFLTWAHREGHDDTLIVAGVQIIRHELVKNRTGLVEPLTQLIRKNAGWKGVFVGANTVEKMLDGLNDELVAIQENPTHSLRSFLKTTLFDYATKIATSGTPEESQLSDLVQSALTDPNLHLKVLKTATGFVRRFEEDPQFRQSFNAEVAQFIIDVLEKSQAVQQATTALASLLKKTEPREFVQRVEKAVWNDLQYIRVNGAIVGGLVGTAIAILRALSADSK